MSALWRGLVLSLALLCGARASLSDTQRNRAASIAHAARSQIIDCSAADACAQPSPLRELGDRVATARPPAADGESAPGPGTTSDIEARP